MAVQLAQIIGTNIYHKQDAPFYHKGNKVSAFGGDTALID